MAYPRRKHRIYKFSTHTAKIRDAIQFAHETIGFSEVCRRYHKTQAQVTRDAANGVIHPLVAKGRKTFVYSTYELDMVYRRPRPRLPADPPRS